MNTQASNAFTVPTRHDGHVLLTFPDDSQRMNASQALREATETDRSPFQPVVASLMKAALPQKDFLNLSMGDVSRTDFHTLRVQHPDLTGTVQTSEGHPVQWEVTGLESAEDVARVLEVLRSEVALTMMADTLVG